jgi:hypothetical protein
MAVLSAPNQRALEMRSECTPLQRRNSRVNTSNRDASRRFPRDQREAEISEPQGMSTTRSRPALPTRTV